MRAILALDQPGAEKANALSAAVTRIADFWGLSNAKLGAVLGLSAATVSRLRAGRTTKREHLDIETLHAAGGEGANRWYTLVTRGGRARDVHGLFEDAGIELSRLMRVSLGPVTMELCPGPTQPPPVARMGAPSFVYGPSGLVARATPTA